ncbi:MAG: type II toxin-antitoxin system RelE family toxin [Bacteroidales bacterium]|jgi:mRNA interferase RelE/StbE
MIVEFDKSFSKSLDKIRNPNLFTRIEGMIIEFENAHSVNDIKNSKKLTGFKNYYRVRIGDYRLGFECISPTIVRLIVVAHRKDIYRMFP